MTNDFYKWLQESIKIIESGIVNRLDKPDGTAKVYKCGTIIRVDIKL